MTAPTASAPAVSAPTLLEIEQARALLAPSIRATPMWRWDDDTVRAELGDEAQVHLKLELWQHAGSFKTRAALLLAWKLDEAQRGRGVTAVSAGNHAMAVSFAARAVGTHAKVVMPKNANPARVGRCRAMGAEVVLVDDVHAAFAEVERIQTEEGRTFLHPFEGPGVALGTATIGAEIIEACPDLDAVIVPVGGGGLAAGIAAAVRQVAPACQVYGVEPVGADTMTRSLAAGEPRSIDRVATIADSLGSPHAAPYSFAICQHYLEAVVTIDDDQIRAAMAHLFTGVKLAVEPAGAAATAALLGPLRDRLKNKRVGLVICGANIDPDTYATHLTPTNP